MQLAAAQLELNFDAPPAPPCVSPLAARGSRNYHAGRAAENRVCDQYVKRGCALLDQRWRGASGEIDLIFDDGKTIIFVEVKCSKTFEAAAMMLTGRQMFRIFNAGQDYLGGLPRGELTPARIDAAVVNATGAIQIIENMILH